MTTTTAAPEILSVQQIRPHPKNVRREVSPSEELVDSIKAHGILQPLLVVPHPTLEGDYLLIAGHNRLAAAKRAGLLEVPCTINTTLTDEAEQLAVMLVENLQRTDLTVGEEAKAYQQLLEFPGWTEAKISKRTGRARDTVHGRVKLASMGDAAITAVEARRATLDDVLKLADAGLPEEQQAEALAGPRVGSWEIQKAIQQWEKEQAAPALLDELRAKGFPVMVREESPREAGRVYPYEFGAADERILERYNIAAVVVDAQSGWSPEYFGKYRSSTSSPTASAPRELSEEEQADAARVAELVAGLKIARRVHEEQVRKIIRTERTIENGRARDALMRMFKTAGQRRRSAAADWLETDPTDLGEPLDNALAKLTLAGLVLTWFATEHLDVVQLKDLEDLETWQNTYSISDKDERYVTRIVAALAVLGSEISDVEREAMTYWAERDANTCQDCGEQAPCGCYDDEEGDDDGEE